MSFSKNDIDALNKDHAQFPARIAKLTIEFVTRKYKTDRGREFGQHGFPRRTKILNRCVDNVFRILPPARKSVPSEKERCDAEISIQAFIFNAFAAVDNLAWIWVSEQALTDQKGRPIKNHAIGLMKEHELVRGSFSGDFQKTLQSFDPWFEHLQNYRHALAHRIPLYIPPFAIHEKDVEKYHNLEKEKTKALAESNIDKHKKLSDEQMVLAEFRPYMQHSFSEGAKTVVFHPQLIADLKTIAELADGILAELKSKP